MLPGTGHRAYDREACERGVVILYSGFIDETLNRKLKRKSHCIFVQLLKCLYKCSKTLATIRFVGAENTVKTFPTVIRDPRKLSAVVV